MLFMTVVAAMLFAATALLIGRRRSEQGFLLCLALYPVFLIGLFWVDGRTLLISWLIPAVINMAIQYGYMRRQNIASGVPSVLLASLVLWPAQYGGLLLGEIQKRESAASADRQRASIGALPNEVSGTVSFTHHIGTETGEDMVWLEEYPDLALMVTSQLFDEIGLAEGRAVTLTVDERRDPESGEAQIWISAGRLQH